jgi:hypothetical protein
MNEEIYYIEGKITVAAEEGLQNSPERTSRFRRGRLSVDNPG